MIETDVAVVAVAVVAVAITAWAKPLNHMPFWLVVVMYCVFYPLGEALLSALESAGGPSSTWAEWIFGISGGLLFITLIRFVWRGLKSAKSTCDGGTPYLDV